MSIMKRMIWFNLLSMGLDSAVVALCSAKARGNSEEISTPGQPPPPPSLHLGPQLVTQVLHRLKERGILPDYGTRGEKISYPDNIIRSMARYRVADEKSSQDFTPHNTVIFVDWDDTLFPTTWMQFFLKEHGQTTANNSNFLTTKRRDLDAAGIRLLNRLINGATDEENDEDADILGPGLQALEQELILFIESLTEYGQVVFVTNSCGARNGYLRP